MKLKILIAPAFIVAIISVSVWVILPQFLGVQKQINELKKSNGKLVEIKEKNKQADALGQELEESLEEKEIIMKFIPQNKKEEEIIDNLYYYATSEGLAIYDLNVSSVKNTAPKDEEAEARTFFSSAIGEDKNSSEKNIEIEKDFSVPKKLEVNLGVVGSYEKIKAFFGKISKLARYNSVGALKIFVAPDESSKSEELGSGSGEVSLQASATLVFNYLEKSDNAVINVDNKIFSDGKLDMAVVEDIRKKMETNMFNLNLDENGRSNPFLSSK